MSTAKGQRLYYGWVVAGVTFVSLLASAGIRAAPGVLITPIETAFGWSRDTISFAISISLLLYGLTGPFAAGLMEWIGVRKTAAAALVWLAGGLFGSLAMRAPWQLVLFWGVIVGSGTGIMSMVMGATVATRWFSRHRGLVMGLLTASTATGQLAFLPLLAFLSGKAGWHSVPLILGVVAIALLPLVVFLMRERPADLGLPALGETTIAPPPQRARNPFAPPLIALAQSIGTLDFWLLFASFFICGLSTNGLIGTHLIAACVDGGIPEVQGAALLASMGIFDFFGTTASGWLSDRVDSRKLLFWYYGLRGLSLIYLPFAFHTFYGLSLFAVFYGLDWIATVPPTVKLTAARFGRDRAGLVYGWIAAGHQLGAATAAYGAGLIRVETGQYLGAFVASGLTCLAAALIVLGIGRRGVPIAGPAIA